MTNNRASTHHLDQSSDQTGINLPVSDQPLDEHGHLLNSDSWSEAWARQQAHALDDPLELNAEHVAILETVRQFYAQFKHAPATRPLIRFIQKELGAEFDNARLMALFHTGLVARTLCRLAGLPKPANCL